MAGNMKKTTGKTKVKLSRETVHQLNDKEAAKVRGAVSPPTGRGPCGYCDVQVKY